MNLTPFLDPFFDIHYSPVKHGWAQRPADWPHSSFAHHMARGVYAEDWATKPTTQVAVPTAMVRYYDRNHRVESPKAIPPYVHDAEADRS